ncbi:MAG TPA: hypothetical protein VI258_10415 [Rhodanobacteraceae bacterium]
MTMTERRNAAPSALQRSSATKVSKPHHASRERTIAPRAPFFFLQLLRHAVKEHARSLQFRVMFRRVETRAAHRVAPPQGHWYKDRAAIQATANCPGDCGVSE